MKAGEFSIPVLQSYCDGGCSTRLDARAGTAQNSPMSSGFETGKALLRGLSREVKPFTRANEKFHLSPISQHGNLAEIIGKFGDADQLRNAVNQLQSLLHAA